MNLQEAIAHIQATVAGTPAAAAQAAAFQHWLLHEATDEERQELAAAHEALLMAADQELEYDKEIAAGIFQKLQFLRPSAQESFIGQEQQKVAPINARRQYRWLVAASLLVLLGAGALFFLRNQNTQQVADRAPLAPGGNKATLMLANGKQIVLDNAADGQIATAGGVSVVKLDSGLIAYQGNSSTVEYNTLTVPRGGQFQLTLPDGTKVWLNAASSLRYPNTFKGDDRRVELQGEGYFEVAQNAAQPFMVKAGIVDVHVLGTNFNVMAYEDEGAIRTTVLSGAVQVRTADAGSVVTPGMQATMLPAQGEQVHHFMLSHPDLDEVVAWKEGKFSFGKTNIRSIMRQLARWYDMTITYEGNVDSVQFEGILSRKESAAELLDAIAATGEVHFKIEGNHVTVIPGRGQ